MSTCSLDGEFVQFPSGMFVPPELQKLELQTRAHRHGMQSPVLGCMQVLDARHQQFGIGVSFEDPLDSWSMFARPALRRWYHFHIGTLLAFLQSHMQPLHCHPLEATLRCTPSSG